jgi:hypothetical protein
MLRCKACEIMRNEACFPYTAVKHDERNAAEGLFQQPASYSQGHRGSFW